MSSYSPRARVLAAAEAALRKSVDPSRRKCFVSYHADDVNEVITFIEELGRVFIPKVIGVSDSDPFVESEDTDYVMQRIREKYLTDSTVTIVLVGRCTWARKYVDWEVFSTLRNDRNNRRSGLIAIELPSRGSGTLPSRVEDNVQRNASGDDIGYARYYVYPSSFTSLSRWIEDAFHARTTRANLINNSRARRMRSADCG